MSDDTTSEKPDEAAGEQPEAAESETTEAAAEATEAAGEESDTNDQPDINDDEQAVVPSDIDPDDIEEEAGADESPAAEEGDTTEDRDGSDDAADGMAPDAEPADPSPAKMGDTYVSVVRSATNAQIRKHGGDELDRDHFEQYDLAEHFNATMDQMGVGSDLEPHEALLLATLASVGDGFVRETDVLDKQMDRLMDKAMSGGSA